MQPESIQKIISDKLGIEETSIQDHLLFEADLGADSLDVYELLTEVEKQYRLTITAEDAEKLTSVGLLIKYIERTKGTAFTELARTATH